MPSPASTLPRLLREHQAEVLNDWISRQEQSLATRRDLISDAELSRDSSQFLDAFTQALESGDPERQTGAPWERLHEMLKNLSVSRARKGFTPSETATFVFSLKPPVFELIRRSLKTPDEHHRESWLANTAIDRLGLATTEVYQKGREEVILRQQQECWSCPRRWSSCGTACWRCRSSAPSTARARRS